MFNWTRKFWLIVSGGPGRSAFIVALLLGFLLGGLESKGFCNGGPEGKEIFFGGDFYIIPIIIWILLYSLFLRHTEKHVIKIARDAHGSSNSAFILEMFNKHVLKVGSGFYKITNRHYEMVVIPYIWDYKLKKSGQSEKIHHELHFKHGQSDVTIHNNLSY